MSVDVSASSLTERLRIASRLSNLDPDRRLDAKLDLSALGVTRRLREASELLRLCTALAGRVGG